MPTGSIMPTFGGYGYSRQSGPGGWINTFDAGAALQQKMAEEQWEWQKGLYAQQQAAAQKAAGGLSSLVSQYNRGWGQARAANEQRYRQMLNIADLERQRQAAVQQRMLGTVGQTTGQRAADIRAEGMREQSNIMQQLTRQGMAGTTVAPTMRAGVRRGTQESLNRLADEMLQQRLGVMGQMAQPRQGTRLGIMERRTDEYPRSDVILALAQALGQGGIGGGMMNALGNMRIS